MAHTPHIDIAHNAITHRARRIAASVAAVCCTLAMVAGCGAADDAADSSGSRNSIVTANSTEPAKGLIPSNTNDMAGWRIASLIYDLSGDKAFVREELPYLEKLVVNTDRRDGLAWCAEDFNRVGFGFHDSIHMTGHLAYCSVLFYDAAVRASRLCKAVGASPKAFDEVAKGVKNNFVRTFWTGEYLKASDSFYQYNDELQSHGFYKYVPEKYYYKPEQVWESGNCVYPTGIYQWGAYWTVGSPHIIGAILKVKGHEAADPIIRDMLQYVFASGGLMEECRSRDNTYHKAVHYVQSCGAVMTCLRMLQGKESVY